MCVELEEAWSLETYSDILCDAHDSLKSMPSSFEGDGKPLENTVVEGDGSLDVEAVGKAAVWLRKKLGLTIIGFDIVVRAHFLAQSDMFSNIYISDFIMLQQHDDVFLHWHIFEFKNKCSHGPKFSSK
jgi:hypothetical protein